MIAGKNGDDFKLYTSDITGNYFEYKAIAIGENDEKLKEELRKSHKKESTIEENIKLGFEIFKKVLGAKFDVNRFSVAYINKDGKLKRLKEEDLKKYK